VDPGDHGVLATEGACYACVPVTLVDGSCPIVDVAMDWHETADKPNVYLYPPRPTVVNVSIAHPERLTADDPTYGDDGWSVTAFPDGRLRTSEGSRDFLFYERSIEVDRFQHEEGFCVPGRQAVAAMEDHLAALGFLPNEIANFQEAWDADLPRAGWMTVYPQTEHLPALRIEPRPDVVLRAWYLVEAGCQPVREPVVTPVERTGFHAAEWGVILDRSLGREPMVIGWPG
jgi:hypothetical protein